MSGQIFVFVATAVVLPLLLSEVGDWAPWLAERLVRWAARRLRDPEACERYAEEWAANVRQAPGKLSKLAVAGSLTMSVPSMRRSLGVGRPSVNRKATASRVGAVPVKPYGPSRHQTIMLHESHYLGRDGLPLKHRSVHTVRAVSDGLARYPHLFDATTTSVEVSRGGKPDKLYMVEGQPGIYAVDILFDRPLLTGQTVSFEYLTTFRYAEPPAPWFRRAVRGRAENLEIRIEFHPDKLPSAVWWAVWDNLEGSVKLIEPVALDSNHAVHRYLEALESAVVGFLWEW